MQQNATNLNEEDFAYEKVQQSEQFSLPFLYVKCKAKLSLYTLVFKKHSRGHIISLYI